MKVKFYHACLAATAVITISTSACHTRKAAGTESKVSTNVAVPPSSARAGDTTMRTPGPRITPSITPNTRPDPVPDTQPPVPPM